MRIFLLLLFMATNCYSNSYIDEDKLSKDNVENHKENLWFSSNSPEKANKFDTLTYLISNNLEHDKKLIDMFMDYAKIIGIKNGATSFEHAYGKKYYILMESANCINKVDPNNIPTIIFYIKSKNKCFVLPYKSRSELTEILMSVSSLLKRYKSDKRKQYEVYKIKLVGTMRALCKKYKLPPYLCSSLVEVFDFGLLKLSK